MASRCRRCCRCRAARILRGAVSLAPVPTLCRETQHPSPASARSPIRPGSGSTPRRDPALCAAVPLAGGAAPFRAAATPSTFDDETALRPYVFSVRGEQVVDIWRGTALSWPLLYARLFNAPDGRELLCALHRGDSFVHRQPQIDRGRRFFAMYEWSGFGFRQVAMRRRSLFVSGSAELTAVFAQLALVFAGLALVFADLALVITDLGGRQAVQLDEDVAATLHRCRVGAVHKRRILAVQGAQAGVVHDLAASIAAVIGGVAAIIAQVAAIIGSAPAATGHISPPRAGSVPLLAWLRPASRLLLTRLAVRLAISAFSAAMTR